MVDRKNDLKLEIDVEEDVIASQKKDVLAKTPAVRPMYHSHIYLTCIALVQKD